MGCSKGSVDIVLALWIALQPHRSQPLFLAFWEILKKEWFFINEFDLYIFTFPVSKIEFLQPRVGPSLDMPDVSKQAFY